MKILSFEEKTEMDFQVDQNSSLLKRISPAETTFDHLYMDVFKKTNQQ